MTWVTDFGTYLTTPTRTNTRTTTATNRQISAMPIIPTALTRRQRR